VLSLVATPIGNLGDITLRALDTLKAADLIACEDTRHSLILLRHYGIEKPLISYHEHNEARRTAELIEQIANGKHVAVISDAGLPGISDPGHRLLRACRERGLPFTIIPGPSAVLTALLGSGLPAEPFFFGGFLPPKSGGRERDLLAALARPATSIFFESPHRILRSLEILATQAPQHEICVARELTKTFEEYRRGPAADILAHYTAHPPKGEIVLVIAPHGSRT
jgi:16S rRNA (cytidine1402-2'-O)-methyltransferase